MRTATPEQKAAAAERRERMRKLAKQISAMDERERQMMVVNHGSVVTIRGHSLSVHNSCMLIYQCNRVSVVGGFRQWKTAGRSVRKGERGLSIWVPLGNDGPELPADDDAEDKGGKPRFALGTVFDVTQTEEIEVPCATL